MYLKELKLNTSKFLFDVGIFYNKFEEETLKVDVIPWILDNAEKFVKDNQAS
jgi:hypothetical protein